MILIKMRCSGYVSGNEKDTSRAPFKIRFLENHVLNLDQTRIAHCNLKALQIVLRQ